MTIAPVHRHVRIRVVAVVAAICATSCGSSQSRDPQTATTADRSAQPAAARQVTGSVPGIRLVQVGRFTSPVEAVAVPGTDAIAVVEQGGRLVIAPRLACATAARSSCPARPVSRGTTVLDLTRDVSTGGERGLLGVAFHPKWPADPRIFVDYTDAQGDTRIESWTLASVRARATGRQTLLEIHQPYANHNGGHVTFGPDGLLYIGMGDGGDAGDPGDRAQKRGEQLGKLLRLDVNRGGARGYAIPPGNVRAPGAPSVWAIGLRNPWRYSFDRATGDLWIGDVGQNVHEEIDVVPASRVRAREREPLNFGWRRFEGDARYDTRGVNGGGELVRPVLDYRHGATNGCSVTGGVVYRGATLPKLRGWYVFADFCGHDLRFVRAATLLTKGTRASSVRWSSKPAPSGIVSIDETRTGELLIVSNSGGIWQVLPS